MVFTSPTFLFFFLPVTLLLNFLFQKFKLRNTILLILSLFFYIFGEGELVLLMIGSITIDYFLGLWIERSNSRISIVTGVTINLLILIVNKYTGFLIENLNALLLALNAQPIED